LVAQSGATASRQLSGGAASGLLSGGTTYAYPLGTGSAWAHPIEWTRVYVVSPPGIDFAVEYPELGPDQSGYVVPFLGATKPRIQNARGPAHAVENAVGDFGRVWRATYMHSNSSEDVIITLLPEMSAETLGALRRLEQRAVLQAGAYVVSILVAVLLWLVVWRYTMPRLLDISYTWREFRLYCHALGWALLYPLTNSVLFGLALVLGPLTAGVSILLGAPLLFVTLLGILSLALFTYWSSQTLKTSPGRAVRAYIVVALASNALYVVYVLSCRTLLGLG
jgi:hypothetical protein